MLSARTENRKRIDPACVVVPSVTPFLSPPGEQPPTGTETVIAIQLGTIPNYGLFPLLLNQREVLKWTRLNKNLLYKYMQDGSFPLPVMVSEGIVRWTSTSIITYLQSSQHTGSTFNGQSQAPPFVHNWPVTFQPLDSNDTDEWRESVTTKTAMTGENGTVTTCWPFPGRLRKKEVLYVLSVSATWFETKGKKEPLLRPHYLSKRLRVWYLAAIHTYVRSLPPAWHYCSYDSDRAHPVKGCRKGKSNRLNGKRRT